MELSHCYLSTERHKNSSWSRLSSNMNTEPQKSLSSPSFCSDLKKTGLLSELGCSLCSNPAFMFSHPRWITDHREAEGDGFPWQCCFFSLLLSLTSHQAPGKPSAQRCLRRERMQSGASAESQTLRDKEEGRENQVSRVSHLSHLS